MRLFRLLTLCTALAVGTRVAWAQQGVQFGIGLVSSNHVVTFLPERFAREFSDPNSLTSAYAEAELLLASRGAWTPSFVTRVSMEGANATRSWPEVRALRAALGSRIEFQPTPVIGLVAGVNGSALMRETYDGVARSLGEAVAPNRFDARAEIGLAGHFGRVRLQMVVERGLAFEAGNIVVYSDPDRTASYLPNYYAGAMRFGLAYRLSGETESLTD